MNNFSRTFLSVSLLLACAMGGSLVASCSSGSCGSSSSSSSCSSTCSTSDSNSGTDCKNDCRGCTSILVGRPALNNSAYFGLNPYLYQDSCEFNTGFVLGYEYQRTFGSCSLAKCLVGGNTLKFEGSQVAGRASTSLLADNFGLSQTFTGSITLNPKITNNNLHAQWYLGFDNWAQGLYLLFDFTFSNQQRSLFNKNCEKNCSTTTTTDTSVQADPVAFPVGYMASGSAVASGSILQALSGDFLFGDMQTKWKFGKWSNCDLKENKVAGFAINFGYNFWICEDSHFGAFVRYEAPTGTKLNGSDKNAAYFFQPVVGNGRHNAVGGGLTAHKELWSNDCGDTITLYIDGYAEHLFKECQIRSFDFKNAGCMSRYMIIKQEVDANQTTNPNPFSTVDQRKYDYAGTNGLINAINYATRPVSSSFDVQGDAAIRFIYKHDCFTVAVGYNIFGRSEEKLCLKSGVACKSVDPDALYAIKGCAGVYSYNYVHTTGAGTQPITAQGTPFPLALNASQSDATIFACGNVDNANPQLTNTNVGVDWVNYYKGTGTAAGLQANAIPVDSSVTTAQVSQAADSRGPVLVTTDSLDLNSGRSPRMITNKGFVTMDYVWDDCCWSPSLGIGAEVEGGSNCCDIKQWGVWVRAGLGF